MDDGVNNGNRRRVTLYICLLLLLSGCSSYQGAAPVINAWSSARSSYVVQPGDTLYSVAWAFNMDYRDLASINNLNAPYHIVAGQRLAMSITTKRRKKVIIRRREPRVRPSKFWLSPAKGKLIKGFSNKRGGNKGINIAGTLGEPIRAANAGLVVYSGTGLRAYGKLIIIKHNASFLSAYAHNRRMLVHEGEVVHRGQKIATMGRDNSGKVMLHFEIRLNGQPINPLKYIRMHK